MALNVVLLESQPLLIEALQNILQTLDDRVEIELAGNLKQLREQLGEAPDGVLVFLSQVTSLGDTLEAVSQLRRDKESAKIVLYCDCVDWDAVRQYYVKGADAVIPNQATGNIVAAATRLVLAGGKYLPPEVFGPSRRHVEASVDKISTDSFRLTPQQRKVLGLLAQGLSNRQIAAQLGIAEGTVKLHVNAILKALDVPNRTAAALIARGISNMPMDELRKAG